MTSLQILVTLLKIGRQNQVVHPMEENNHKLDEETEEDVVEQTTLTFPRWNC